MYRSLFKTVQLSSKNQIVFKCRCLNLFCTSRNNNKAHSVAIARQMLAKYQQYRPWKTIHLIHTITMAKLDPDFSNQTYQFRQDEQLIEIVLNSISSQMHLVPHKQVNMLLDILRQRGYSYNLDMPIFRAINKQIKLLFGKQFKQQMLSKTLFLLKTLKFPKLTINKILDELAELTGQPGQSEAKNNFTLTNMLKLAIFSLEQTYITIPIVKKWMNLAFQLNADTLSSLCCLYHINLIAEKCLRAKVDYQYKKTNSKEILFNPYNQLSQDNKEPKEQRNSQQKSQQIDNQRLLDIKKKLTDMSNQLLNTINNTLDAKKLQSAIIKNVQENVQPFTKDLILYSCDISQLKPVIEQFVRKHLHELTPVELIYLLKRCSKEISQSSIDSYLSKLSEHMSLEQQAYIYIEAYNLYHRSISKDLIIKLLEPLLTINYQQFMAIVRLIELMPSVQQNNSGVILQLIKQKMKEEQNQSKPNK